MGERGAVSIACTSGCKSKQRAWKTYKYTGYDAHGQVRALWEEDRLQQLDQPEV